LCVVGAFYGNGNFRMLDLPLVHPG
jgi:hypothetical protein